MSEQKPNGINEQFIAESSVAGLPWRLLIFGVVVLALAIAIYLGLRFGYGAYLDAQFKDTEKRLDDLARQVKPEDQKNFIGFYSQLINLKSVLDTHEFGSKVFSFLEKNTLSSVYYTEASFLASGKALTLKGAADTSETLVGQMNVFDKTPELLSVSLDQMNFDPRGGSVSFSAMLTFNPEYFLKP